MKRKEKSLEAAVLEIRYAVSMDDPLEISKVYEESWKYAYKGIIPRITLTLFRRGGGHPVSTARIGRRWSVWRMAELLGQAAFAAPVLNSFSDGVK